MGDQRYVRIKDSCFGEIQVPRNHVEDTYAGFICTVIQEYGKRNRNIVPNLIKCFNFINARWLIPPEAIVNYLERHVELLQQHSKKISTNSRISQAHLSLMRRVILPKLRGTK
jgi:hypothetical protein